MITVRSCNDLVPESDDFYQLVSNMTPKQKAAILTYDKNWFTTEQLVLRSFLINAIFFITLCFGTYRVKNPSLLNILESWLKIRQKLIASASLEKDTLSEEVREAIISPADATLKLLQLCIDYDTMEESDQIFPPSLNRLDPLTCLLLLQFFFIYELHFFVNSTSFLCVQSSTICDTIPKIRQRYFGPYQHNYEEHKRAQYSLFEPPSIY